MIDLYADIVPWKGLGGIDLYSHIGDFYSILRREKTKSFLYDNLLVRYEITKELYLFFNLVNGKLFKITTLQNYKGKLFNKINVGMHIDEVLKFEPTFEYDDFEEVYFSSKGIFIETDPVTHKVIWISVYIKELDNEDFIEGNW